MNKLFIKLIDIYQKARKNDGKHYCRYLPSCSNYAKEAFQKFNFFKAFFLSIFRIIRCNPLFKGGYDPVPLTKKEKQLRKQRTEEFLKEIPNLNTFFVNHI